MTKWLLMMFIGTVIAAVAAESFPENRPFVFGINRIGDSGILFGPPDYDRHLYQRIKEIGGTCVRLAASPRDIEPVRGKRNWSEFEKDLNLAIEFGLEPMVLIVNTPAWASPTGESTHLYPYKTELLPEFADFCADLARRTKGKVKYFQIWNEQNGCSWHFHDGFNHADEYVPILRTAYKALKKENPDCFVFLGGLDDAEGHAPIFMRKTYEERDKQFPGERIFDGVTDHPYSDDAATMKKKLDAIREIMVANGDGDLPIWITEYGWHTGGTPEDLRVKRVSEVLQAFCRPDWNFLLGAIYLSLSDFEGGIQGFGLTDANLRPRVSFYAFQGAPRFGASPPFNIEWWPASADSMEVTWNTTLPANSYLEWNGESLQSPMGRRHSVIVKGMKPGETRVFTITTVTADGKTYKSAPYTIRAPHKKVFNGDFEQGFFAGIGEGWNILGDGFCTDTRLVPDAPAGTHGQSIYAFGEKSQRLNSTAWTYCATTPGRKVTVSAKWASEVRGSDTQVMARLGLDPEGGNDAGSPSVIWTDWCSPTKTWSDVSLSITPKKSVVSIFFQCRSEGDLGKGTAFFYLDDVKTK